MTEHTCKVLKGYTETLGGVDFPKFVLLPIIQYVNWSKIG